jgi:hypothetical protein
MKKVCLFFSVLMCVFMGSFSYAQPYDADNAGPGPGDAPYAQNYDDNGGQYSGDGGNCGCPPCNRKLSTSRASGSSSLKALSQHH